MKKHVSILLRMIPAALVFRILLAVTNVAAQADQPAKLQAELELKYTKFDSLNRQVTIKLYHKEGKEITPIQFSIINLYVNDISKAAMMGNITTDENGEGNVPLNHKFASVRDTIGTSYTLIGSLQNNPYVEDIRTELGIREANLAIQLYEEDSVKKVKATVVELNDARELVPVNEVEVHFYVQRLFSLLPITEDPVSTDENGEAIADFPTGLKGDSIGNLTVVVKIEEHEKYGTLETRQDISWGIPVRMSHFENRYLWSSRANAPIPLVILSNVIIAGVWGVIFYIVFQLFKLKKYKSSKNKNV